MQSKSNYGSYGLVVAVFKTWFLILLHQTLAADATYWRAEVQNFFFWSMNQFSKFVELTNVEEVLVTLVIVLNE